MIQADSIRELVKVRDKLEAWQETAQRKADYHPIMSIQQQNRNLVANYGTLIEQLEDVIDDLTDHIWD